MTDLAALLAEREYPMARWNVPGPHQPRTTPPLAPRLDRADLLDQITHLRGTDSPEGIAARLGYSSARTLGRRLHRLGEHELAAPFERKAAA